VGQRTLKQPPRRALRFITSERSNEGNTVTKDAEPRSLIAIATPKTKIIRTVNRIQSQTSTLPSRSEPLVSKRQEFKTARLQFRNGLNFVRYSPHGAGRDWGALGLMMASCKSRAAYRAPSPDARFSKIQPSHSTCYYSTTSTSASSIL
jgi:hypothetical protein